MAKKAKGKQKQEETPVQSDVNPNPLPSDPANLPMGTENNYPPPSQPEPQGSTWGASEVQGWGSNVENAGDTWGAGTPEQDEAWAHSESLLQPPPTHAHSILPTIHEQPSSGHFTQNRTALSDVGESQGEYSDYQQDPQSPHGGQSRTLTATALPSAMGSPAQPPMVSLAEAAEAAQKDRQKHQKISSASEAARKLEESRAHLNNGYSTRAQSTAVSPAVHYEALNAHLHAMQTPTGHKPLSIASAAAAAMESSTSRRVPNPSTAQPFDPPQPGKTQWSYPKPFLPGSRAPARIKVDPSWTMTGGNAWSNKHRHTQSASAPNFSQGNNDAWNQVPPYQGGLQHTQQAHQANPHPSQQRPRHSKHHSHPGHPTQQRQQRHQPQPQQTQSWQEWGKESWDHGDSESESDDETINGWGNGTQNGGNDWGQPQAAWGQQPANPGKGEGKRERGRGRGRKVEDEWGHGQGGQSQGGEWGQGMQGAQGGGQGWDQGNAAWGQPAGAQQGGHAGGWDQPTDDWSQQQRPQQQQRQGGHQTHQQSAWGQAGETWAQEDWGKGDPGRGHGAGDSGLGNGAGDSGWGKGASDSGWGKGASDSGWGKGGGDSGRDKGGEAAWGAGAGEWGAGTSSNADWGVNAHTAHQSKVTFASAEAAGTRNVVSPQQRSQILNSLLNQQPQNQKPQSGNAAHIAAQQAAAASASKKVQGQQKENIQQDRWGGGAWETQDTGWGSMDDDDDDDEDYDGNRRVHFSPKASDIWGGSPRSVPSKALAQAHAQQGVKTTLINDASNVRFVESRGAAFDFVSEAFFGNARLARERIHWLFPTNKDERVANMLAWVQKMSFNLGTYGLMKFLEHKERGALFVNTLFRMHEHPREPAFDYLTFNHLQGTMDKTLQESVAFYDPAQLVIVFVYLPSQTGNSVAIWRRKVNVPDNARLKHQVEVNAIVRTLRKDKEYIVMVDELPPKAKTVPQKPGQLRKSAHVKANSRAAAQSNAQAAADKKKRKWWKLFLS